MKKNEYLRIETAETLIIQYKGFRMNTQNSERGIRTLDTAGMNRVL